jgi:thioredoxin reductase (NADPH)
VCGAQELVDRLLQQIKPFEPAFHFNNEVTQVTPLEGGRFDVRTAGGLQFDAGAIVIAGGLGSFQPKKLGVAGIDDFEDKNVFYRVRNASEFHGKRIVIFGGGDSALDWVLDWADKAHSLTLVHRRPEFRAAPASVARMQALVAAGKLTFIEGIAENVIRNGDLFEGIEVKGANGARHALAADRVLAFFGLHPKLGPIAEWHLQLEKKALLVDTEKFQTSVPGIFAVGDINTYPGKKKLILSGFHEAALAAFAIQHHLYPEKRQFLQYTTTSPIMQKRLGVTDSDSQSSGI